eukprot:1005304-Heterocapsa_arctica.AAC.1
MEIASGSTESANFGSVEARGPLGAEDRSEGGDQASKQPTERGTRKISRTPEPEEAQEPVPMEVDQEGAEVEEQGD